MKKRGNPLYRDERVHWWKKEETSYTEMKEFTSYTVSEYKETSYTVSEYEETPYTVSE
jgi:hypothetical protein